MAACGRPRCEPSRSGDGKLKPSQLAQAMWFSGTVNHTVAGDFRTRVAGLRKSLAVENVAAGFATFPETLKQWENSAGHRENLLIPGARRGGVASVANPKQPCRMVRAMIITDERRPRPSPTGV
jgi:uncharacterized protein YkwD